MLINEWQLGNRLNQSLDKGQAADFRLWLAMLSPAIEEQAEFCREVPPKPADIDYRALYQLPAQRSAGLQDGDVAALTYSQTLLIQQGLTDWRLQSLLCPPPQVVRHDAKKLSADIWDNLSLHCRRHLTADAAGSTAILPDPALLLDVLDRLTDEPVVI